MKRFWGTCWPLLGDDFLRMLIISSWEKKGVVAPGSSVDTWIELF